MHPPIEVLFLDLDDTLYPPSSGLWTEIGRRIDLYMVERMGIPPESVRPLRERYFRQYGTTLNGLRALHHVDPRDYLAFVHDLPLADFLHRDEALRKILTDMPQRKWIFSNADRAHIERVLDVLGLRDVFAGIIDIYATGFVCKPNEQAYRLAMQLAGADRPESCMLVDDQPRNLEPAARLGMTAILVDGQPVLPDSALHIHSIHDLALILSNQPSG